jgi:thioredoxin 1
MTDNISLSDYQRITSKGKVVAYFTATWCGPCKKIKPVFDGYERDSLAKMDDVVYLKIDVDKHDDISSSVGIKAMPTFLFYVNGSLEVKITGANAKELQECFAQFLALDAKSH